MRDSIRDGNVLSGGGRWTDEDELRPVTSLFADVVGSTSLGERLPASDIKALIGDCISRMCESIEAFGGSVRSYMGDGIAGFFGIDGARADDNERAARAGLDIRRVVADYAREVQAAWGVADFNVRIGINSGRVAVGRIGAGDPQRLALGDSINVAARLQSAARPGSIVVGASVAEAIVGRFILRPLGALEVRGRTGTIEAFELDAEDELPLSAVGRAPFVGRARELRALAASVSDLSSGRGQVVLVTGEGGLGKSRLIAEARNAVSSEFKWLGTHCYALDHRSPYEPFRDALCAWLGVGRHASPIEVRVRLTAAGRPLLGDSFDDCGPFLARLLGISLAARLERRLDGLSPHDLELGLMKAVGDWLSALSLSAPVVFVIDNFCSATEPTARLTESLLARIESRPILLVASARSEVAGPWEQFRARALTQFRSRSQEIHVPPLTRDESSALVALLTNDCPLEPSLGELVVSRAEGNPLYIEELLSAVAGRTGVDAAETLAVPVGLEGALLARIDSLAAGPRVALQAAAVLGRAFMHDVLVRMVRDGNGTDPDIDVAELLRAEIIREHSRHPKAYAFRHGLIRDAALSTLTPSRLRALNKSAATALEGWNMFDQDRDSGALVGYYLNAGCVDEAAHCLAALSTQLARMCQWEDAEESLELCLDGLRRSGDAHAFARAAAELAKLLAARGKLESAIEWLDQAVMKEPPSERGRYWTEKAGYLAELGLHEESDYLLQRCIATSVDRATVMRAWIERGKQALNEFDRSRAAACVSALDDTDDLALDIQFDIAHLRAGVSAMSGALDDAEAHALRAQDLSNKLGQVSLQLGAKRLVALICMLKGCYREATDLTEDVYQQCSQLGLLTEQTVAALNLMHLRLHSGDLCGAALVGEDVLGEPISARWRGLISSNLAAVRCEQGEFAAAHELVKVVTDLASHLPRWTQDTARMVNAAVARAEGNHEVEEEELKIAYERALSDEFDRGIAALSSELAVSLLRRGDREAAAWWVAQAVERNPRDDRLLDLDIELARVFVGSAMEPGHGVRDLSRAREDAARMGLRLFEARALVALGEIDPPEREAHFANAERIFRECGSELGLAELNWARARAMSEATT